MKQRWIAVGEMLLGHRGLTKGIAVSALDESSEERGPTGGADRRRYESVRKPHAVSCQRVDVGCPDDRVASATERVVALIVDQEEEDVGGLSGCRLSTAACGKSCAAQGADGLSSCEVHCGARLARATAESRIGCSGAGGGGRSYPGC